MKPSNRIRLLSTHLAVLALLIMVGPAAGATKFKSVRSGPWKLGITWDQTACSSACTGGVDYPAAGDTGVVNAAHAVTLTGNESVTHLIIQPVGLVVTAGNTLTISSALDLKSDGFLYVNSSSGKVALIGGGVHRVSGIILLAASGSKLKIEETMLLTAGGTIIGQSNGAAIVIDGGKTLTSEITIEGALVIATGGGAGTGTFVNDGTVNAGERFAGQKIVTFAVEVTVEGHGEFRVGEFSATDKIDFLDTTVTATGLEATFTLLDGVLDINTPFHTTGRLRLWGGVVQCNPGVGAHCIFEGS